MVEFWQSLARIGAADGRKSTVLRPIQQTLAIVLLSLVGTLWQKGEVWIATTLVVLLCVLGALFVCAYVYFAIRNPEQLRSESYRIRMKEIETGYVGDNLRGISDPAMNSRKALPPNTEEV